MAIFVFLLTLALLAAGAAGAYMSLDLLPTGLGLLYAFSGAVAASMAILAFVVGVLVWRIGKLSELVGQSVAQPAVAEGPAHEPSPMVPPPLESEVPAQLAEDGGHEPASRAGHPVGEIEGAIAAPAVPPSLVGRYSAGGANYMIFNDGSIEAETKEGTYKFSSMIEFKRYLAERRSAKR